jgi:hypothetical protein
LGYRRDQLRQITQTWHFTRSALPWSGSPWTLMAMPPLTLPCGRCGATDAPLSMNCEMLAVPASDMEHPYLVLIQLFWGRYSFSSQRSKSVVCFMHFPCNAWQIGAFITEIKAFNFQANGLLTFYLRWTLFIWLYNWRTDKYYMNSIISIYLLTCNSQPKLKFIQKQYFQ